VFHCTFAPPPPPPPPPPTHTHLTPPHPHEETCAGWPGSAAAIIRTRTGRLAHRTLWSTWTYEVPLRHTMCPVPFAQALTQCQAVNGDYSDQNLAAYKGQNGGWRKVRGVPLRSPRHHGNLSTPSALALGWQAVHCGAWLLRGYKRTSNSTPPRTRARPRACARTPHESSRATGGAVRTLSMSLRARE
jgi:hypothetical protein